MILRAALAISGAFAVSSTGCAGETATPHPLLAAGHVSVDVLNMLVAHPVEDTLDVRERSGRALTVGKARTQGNVFVQLVPDATKALWEYRMQGELHLKDAVSYQGPVQINSTVRTSIDAGKRVAADQNGLSPLPAKAACDTRIQIRNISARWPFIERLGWRRSRRKLGEAERSAAQRTARQIEKRLDERIAQAMEEMDARFFERLSSAEAGAPYFPPEVRFRSSPRFLQVWVESDPERDLPLPSTSVSLDPKLDLHVILHEGYLAALAEDQLGHRRILDRDVLELVEWLRGSAPWVLWVHERRPPWSITLAQRQPLAVRFQQGQIDVRIRLCEAQFGTETLRAPIEITLTVRPEITVDGTCLRRLTGPTVRIDRAAQRTDQTKTELASATEDRFATLIRQKLEGIFPPEFYFDGLQTPVGGSWDRIRRLHLTQLTSDNGWFNIGYQYQK
jgi:hypothetical protein